MNKRDKQYPISDNQQPSTVGTSKVVAFNNSMKAEIGEERIIERCGGNIVTLDGGVKSAQIGCRIKPRSQQQAKPMLSHHCKRLPVDPTIKFE
jgi:hypothetical protein